LAVIACAAVASHAGVVHAEPVTATVTIDASNELRTFSPRRIGGTNVALWNEVAHFKSPELRQWIEDLKPGYIRLPGGSWSNSIYWNGNGVRDADGKVDPTKVGPDGYPAVDYSGYAPAFGSNEDHAAKVIRPSTGYSGNVDVKTLHDWITTIPGAEPMPCLNAGTGRPIDAAEWVRFANFTNPQYHAKIWEIGNELDGSWEPGHFMLGSKKPVDGDEYARRYNAIASAMKQLDPSIKIGGCAFPEAMIREGGKNVDFVSIHTYPGTTSVTPQQNLANTVTLVAKEVSRVRNWIRQYQPERERDIEISYTEWNLAGGLSGADLFSGLWHSLFLSQMAVNGVDFATQWDVFTHVKGMKSGHALIWTDGDRFVRKPGYYAMWLWNNYTGNRLIASQVQDGAPIYSFASRDDAAVYVQLINPDEDREAIVTLDLKSFDAADAGERVTLSSRSFFWNDLTHEPVWSESPRAESIATKSSFAVTLPPFSVTHVRVPAKGSAIAVAPAMAQAEVAPPELRFVLPDEIYAGDRVPGHLLALQPGAAKPYPVALGDATIGSDSEGALDRDRVRLAEAAGRFFVTAKSPGTLTLHASVNGVTISKGVTVKPSEPRPVVLWDFRKPELTDAEAFSSELGAKPDMSVRANKDVARIDFPVEGVKPSEKDKTRALLVMRNIPKSVDRANIRGVVFDLKGQDLASDDPNAAVLVVMQSPADYWMVLGRVPLSEVKDWTTHQVVTTRQSYIDAMGSAYNVWFVLDSAKPVRGTLMLDKVGLMVR
jgi:hypothetical protein